MRCSNHNPYDADFSNGVDNYSTFTCTSFYDGVWLGVEVRNSEDKLIMVDGTNNAWCDIYSDNDNIASECYFVGDI